jgi:hypothetical protein
MNLCVRQKVTVRANWKLLLSGNGLSVFIVYFAMFLETVEKSSMDILEIF